MASNASHICSLCHIGFNLKKELDFHNDTEHEKKHKLLGEIKTEIDPLEIDSV